MNANELARKIGTEPPVMAWNSSVPAPAVKRATDGSSPVSSGTSTSAPNATNNIWMPNTSFRPGVIESIVVSSKRAGKLPGVGVEPT